MPKEECRQVERQECYDIPRQVPREQCNQVARQECTNVPRQQPKEVCNQVSYIIVLTTAVGYLTTS